MKGKGDINISLLCGIKWLTQKNEFVTGLCEQSHIDNQNGSQLYNQSGLLHTGTIIFR